MGRKGRKIVGYHLTTGNIRVFESRKEAADWLGLLPPNITASLTDDYTGSLEGWVFFYYEEYIDSCHYSSPDGVRKRCTFYLKRFYEARERDKCYVREKLELRDYVRRYLRDLVDFRRYELREYEIKIAELNYELSLLSSRLCTMKNKLKKANNDMYDFKRLADILSDPGKANWQKEKYLNLMEICQDVEMKTESINTEMLELSDYKENIRDKYETKYDEMRELESIYSEFVGILEGENL